jgi:hypothetical protein
MSESVLLDHGAPGAREVSLEELGDYPAPPSTTTWFPVSHSAVINRVEETLDAAGFAIDKRQLLVSHSGQRMFATLDLKAELSSGVTLSVGVRNSTDKTFPIGFCCGSRVFVCSNLAFRSEVEISRRHTRFGEHRFAEATSLAVQGLHVFQAQEHERISRLQAWELAPQEADSFLLRAFEKQIVSSRVLPDVVREWRSPSFEAFAPRTAWSLLNSFTHVFKARQLSSPQRAARLTMSLYKLLQPEDVTHGEIAIAT